MKAKTVTVSVDENGLNVQDGKKMICKMIDNKINNYNMQFLTDWERDHSISPMEKDQKIEKLRMAKEKLINFCAALENEEGELSFTFNLEVKFNGAEGSYMAEDKMVMSA